MIDLPDSEISISLSDAQDKSGGRSFLLKIQGRDWELNILLAEDELALVRSIKTSRWSDRSSIEIGKSAGASVFWSCEDRILSILVGHDDETWDFGVMVPEGIIDEIISEIEHQH